MILKIQQKFKNERHNVITKEDNKNDLSWNDDERMQSVELLEKYAYRTRKV